MAAKLLRPTPKKKEPPKPMAQVTRSHVSIEVKAKLLLELDEEEARALSGIFGYSVEAFLKVFYERIGQAYVKPFEAGVRRLHETVRGAVAGPLAKADEARRLLAQLP